MRTIDILLFNQINLLDVAGPAQAFSSAIHHDHKASLRLFTESVDHRRQCQTNERAIDQEQLDNDQWAKRHRIFDAVNQYHHRG